MERCFEKDKNIKTLLKSVSKSIKKTGKKYVIFIDDLDRLEMPAIKNILKVIMIISEIDGLIFLIAASSEHICADKKIISKEYIEKIMTVILPIPKINHTQIKEYFFKEFYEIIKDEKYLQEENEEIERMKKGFSSLNKLCNLRNIKRLLYTFKLLYIGLVREVDAVDFIFIVYLHMFFPEIEEKIYNNRCKYVDVDLMDPCFIGYNDEKDNICKELGKKLAEGIYDNGDRKEKSSFEECISSYPQQDKNNLQVILSMMFPKCDEWWGGKHYCKHSKGISDPKYFYKYFRFFIDEGDIEDKNLDEHIREWKESKDLVDDIRKVLAQYCNDRRINVFFKKLEAKKEMIGAELLKKIAKEYSTFDTNDENDFSSFINNNFRDDKVFLED